MLNILISNRIITVNRHIRNVSNISPLQFSVDESSQQPSSQLIKPFSFLDSQYRKFSGRNHEDDESASSLYVPLLPSSLASNSVVPNSYLSMQQGSNQCTPVMSYQPRSRHFVVIEISNGKFHCITNISVQFIRHLLPLFMIRKMQTTFCSNSRIIAFSSQS